MSLEDGPYHGQEVIIGNCLDVLKTMPDESVDVCVTSPPYWALRDYGSKPVEWPDGWMGQLGLESTFTQYINHLIMIFDEVKRVLRSTGTCWVNLGDTYNGNKNGNTDNKQNKVESGDLNKIKLKEIPNKSLCSIPSRFAIAMTDAGWCLRNKIIWHKPNVMPQSCDDRFTNDYEEFFFFTKNPTDYYFRQQLEPVKEVSLNRAKYGYHTKKGNIGLQSSDGIDISVMGERFVNSKGRNMRAVWTIPTSANKMSHVAMFPIKLIETPINACCPHGGTVIDPFCGSGTTLEYCRKHDINAIGIEINPEYEKIISKRALMDIEKIDNFSEASQ